MRFKDTSIGKIPVEWEIKKLVEVTIKIGSGATPRGGNNVYTESGIPFIRSQNIYNCDFSGDGMVFINNEHAKKLKNVEIEENDVLLNITGDSVARCTIIPKKYVGGRVNQHVAIIRTNQQLLQSDFLKYHLVSPNMQSFMLSLARMGGTRAALTKGMIENFEIPLPALNEQKSIANILSTLDEKMEINNQVNKILEEMAQTMFKRWFVDFEFPHEDGKPYKSSGGEMIESELGMIPREWEVTSIEDIAEKANTGADAIRRAPIVDYDTGIKCVRVGDLSQKRQINGWGFCKVSEEDFKKFQLKINDIIITRTGTIGLNMLIFKDLNAVFNNGLIRLRIKDNYNPIFMYQVINSNNYFDYINKITGETSTRPNMKINYLLKYKFALPPKTIREQFAQLSYTFISRIHQNNIENERLLLLRDTLLPILMSGEIRVPIDNEEKVVSNL